MYHPCIEMLVGRDEGGNWERTFTGMRAPVEALLDKLKSFMTRVFRSPFSRESVRACWTRRLTTRWRYHGEVTVRKRVARLLLLSGVATPLQKIVALAARRRGTRVVGFVHGNDMVNLWSRFRVTSSMCTVSRSSVRQSHLTSAMLLSRG